MAPVVIDFPPFQLDLSGWQLRRDGTPVPLRPKTFAFLRCLAERPGELVTKRALLDAVWPGVAVTEDVVRLSARELRAALGDQPTAPRFVETVPRLGYRFIATMGPAAAPLDVDDARPTDDLVVGREHERSEIATWLRAATSGRRQLGFVTGEAGIGKTTLVDVALSEFRRTAGANVRIARGQCIEQYGGGEPYLPVLEAIAALRNGSEGAAIEESLRRHAPRWLLDSRRDVSPAEADRVNVAAAGTFEHTLHMLAATLDALTEDRPLVLVFEDVHWSDYSTLDLLSVLAQSRAPARLLVLCTLRPVDAIVRGHPLIGVKRELLRKGHCREILLGGLAAKDVASYLAQRFLDADLPGELLPLLVERSDGSPFVVVALLDHLLEHEMLVRGDSGWEFRGNVERVRTAIPDGLRAIIEPRLERLPADERHVLEVASVVGPEFPAHAVAAAAPPGSDLGDVEVVEQLCDTLARRQELLRASGESAAPDGTTSARYAFRHVLYQQVLDQGLKPSQRRRLHQRIGEQLEARYAGRTEDVASALASHFECSGDVERAVRYHGEAAAQARSRFAFQETRLHVEAALRLMRERPETTEAMRRQVPMLDDLGWASVASRGWGDEGTARAFARMRELAERLDGAEARFKAMQGELTVHTMRAEYAIARQRGEEMLLLAEEVGNRMAVAGALPSLGATLLHLGEVEAAEEIGERGRALGDPREPTLHAISCCSLIACSSAQRGLVDRARAMNGESVGLAAKSSIPLLRAYAATFAASVSEIMRDVATTRSFAEEAVRIASDLGFSVVASTATIYRAWCDVQDGRIDEGVEALRSSFDAYVASGQRISTSSYSLPVVEGYLAAGDTRRASALLDRALAFVAETGERIVEPEIYRLKGECLLAAAATRGQRAEAITCFERAVALAAGQKTLLFELRAASSLYRVRPKATRERLSRLVARFAPEDECVDLREAAALLGT